MPKLTTRLPKYRKHKGSGQAVVTLNGQDYYLGVHGTAASKREYDRLTAEWQANGRKVVADDGISVSELILAYLKHATAYYVKDGKPTAELDCIKSAMRPLKARYGHTPVANFGPLAAKAVREQMLRDDWSRGFINRCMGRIKRMLRWGVENELVPPGVYAGVKEIAGLHAGRSTARETPGRHPVPLEHIEAVRRVVRQRTRDLIDLMLFSAARPGELLSLTTAMIDQRGEVWTARLAKHKTMHQGKARTLYFGPQAQLILRRHLKPHAPHLRLFPFKSFRNALKNACDKLKLPRFTPHWLRHTAATRLREAHGAEAAQVLLGHARLDMTELYAAKSEKLARQVAISVG
jgi:integrase